MTTARRRPPRAAFAVLLLTGAASIGTPTLAQDTPSAIPGIANSSALQDPPAAPTPTPVPVPDAPRIVLPTATPASRVTTTPRPSAPKTDRTTVPAAEARPKTSAPRTIEAPKPQPTPAPATSSSPPISSPTAVSTPTATPQPVATPAPTLAAPVEGRTMPFWLWLAVIVVVVGALWLLRRRPSRDREAAPAFVQDVPLTEAEELAPVPVPAAPQFLQPRETPLVAAAISRARLTLDLRPLRAGLNLLSAAAECELTVTNTGDAPADAVRIHATLLTAHAGQDADLAAANAAPIGRPATPPFALAPSESRTLRLVSATPRDAIHTLTAANRPMFVPIVAVNARYAGEGLADGQTTRAWAIGIERVDSPKLAPFWLDGPAKMYDAVAARPHAAALER